MAYKKNYFNFTYSDFRKDYLKIQIPEGEDHLNFKTYKSFIKDFFEECFYLIMRSKFHLTMPFGLGDFYLKEQGLTGRYKVQERKNLHTFGKSFKFWWDRTYAVFDNEYYIEFKGNDEYRKKKAQFYRDVESGKERAPQAYSYPIKNFTKID